MKTTFFLIFICIQGVLSAQTFTTLKGQVNFSSNAPEENIEAINNSVAAQLIFSSGRGQFIIPIKSFKFKKALLQEHFNENYMESDQYPKATYKYSIANIHQVDLTKPGRYAVTTAGSLVIKNTTRNIEVPGFITVTDNQTIKLEASFNIKPEDYDIKIPALVVHKIAKSIEITVNTTLNKNKE